MKLFLAILFTFGVSAYSQEATLIISSEEQTDHVNTQQEITQKQICQDFLIEITILEQEQIGLTAKLCKNFYIEELKAAIELINKNEKTACDFVELKEQVALFNEIIDSYVEFEGPDKETLEQMREFYLIMYTSDNMIDCDKSELADILVNQFKLENSLNVIRN